VEFIHVRDEKILEELRWRKLLVVTDVVDGEGKKELCVMDRQTDGYDEANGGIFATLCW
jgi:hypothetical protein